MSKHLLLAPLLESYFRRRLTRQHNATPATVTTDRPALADKPISSHIFRHSLAMKLLQSGVDLLTIQAWLGHAQVATTHRYAAADVEMMRNGLEKAGVDGNCGVRSGPTTPSCSCRTAFTSYPVRQFMFEGSQTIRRSIPFVSIAARVYSSRWVYSSGVNFNAESDIFFLPIGQRR